MCIRDSAEGLHVAIDTAGSIPLEQCRQAVDAADLLLLDLKALDPALCRTICGSDGARAKEQMCIRDRYWAAASATEAW